MPWKKLIVFDHNYFWFPNTPSYVSKRTVTNLLISSQNEWSSLKGATPNLHELPNFCKIRCVLHLNTIPGYFPFYYTWRKNIPKAIVIILDKTDIRCDLNRMTSRLLQNTYNWQKYLKTIWICVSLTLECPLVNLARILAIQVSDNMYYAVDPSK